MGKALENINMVLGLKHREDGARDWRKAMNNNVAIALLAYTVIQIFVASLTAHGSSSVFRSIGVVFILILVVIPFCRTIDRRWSGLSDEEGTDPARASAYRRDRAVLWLFVIALPFAVSAIL